MRTPKTAKPATAETANGLQDFEPLGLLVRDYVKPNPNSAQATLIRIVLVVTPASRAGYFETRIPVEPEPLVVSRQPMLDGARALISRGYDANDTLEIYRPGATSWDLRAPLRLAARLDVAETPYGPKFVRHRPPAEGCLNRIRSTVDTFLVRWGAA
jgi:hypothetical protein